MTREEAVLWLGLISTRKFGWDEYAMQESQREIRERCEQSVKEALNMAVKALSIVRCKDCRHRYEEGDCTHYYWCRLNDRPVDDTDYCAWGEKGAKEE